MTEIEAAGPMKIPRRDQRWFLRTGLTYLAAPFVGALFVVLVAAALAFPKVAAVTVFLAVGLSGAAFAAFRQRNAVSGTAVRVFAEHSSDHRLR